MRANMVWSVLAGCCSMPMNSCLSTECGGPLPHHRELPMEDQRMIQAIQPESSARGIAWDLGDLYKGVDDPQINKDLEAALRRAQAFEEAYRGKIGTEHGPAPDLLLAAIRELESLSEQMDRPVI